MILPNIAAVGQRKEPWGSQNLGNSTEKINLVGCVLICADIICRFYGKDVWPDWLNEQMVKVNGYYAKNLWQWHKLSEIFSDITVHDLIDCYDVPAPLDKIRARLDEGHPVIVCVDFDPAAGVQTHYVVIFGYEGEDKFYIADPWYNDIALLKDRYGDPAEKIYAIRMYNGPLSGDNNVNELDEVQKELVKLKADYEQKDALARQYKADAEKWQNIIESAKNNINNIKENINEIEKKFSGGDN